MVMADFIIGDSRTTVKRKHTAIRQNIEGRPALAWVDGGHDVPYAYADLVNIANSGIHYILVDDHTGSPDVPVAVKKFMDESGEFMLMENPYEGDKRGIVLLVREIPNE